MTNLERAAHESPAQELERRDSDLRLIVSPVVESEEKIARATSVGLGAQRGDPDVEDLGFRYKADHDCPAFIKHSASTNYELFYDLWFVANLEVFSSSKGVSKESDLYSYIGYLSILWFTWFLVGMFDVRFVTDSIFERIIRTAHLGVMVGFSVVVTNFDPEKQEKKAFQTLSIILMVSRLVLVIQYATIIWHIRHYKKGKYPVAAAAVIHFVSAMIFLGVTFRFEDGKNSRVYLVWYIISACEALLQLGLAKYYNVLTFTSTHLTERMTILTVIILGGGVTSVAKNVVLIVKNAAGWTGATIGVLTSAIATMYFFFMIYFDWMNHHHLSGWRQLTWSILHFPFHVALLLFMEGATQFMIWWKVNEVEDWVGIEFNTLVETLDTSNATITSELVASSMNSTVQEIFAVYPSTYTLTDQRVASLLADIASFNESYWYADPGQFPHEDAQWDYDTTELVYTIVNSLFVNFKIDPFDGMDEQDPTKMQDAAITDLNTRYNVVFEFAYATAGLVLMLMTIMFVLTKKHGWTLFIIFRTALFFIMGLGLALIVLLASNEQYGLNYLLTPWLLPTICIVFFVVILLSHLPHPPPLFFKGKAKRPHSPDAAYSGVRVQEVSQGPGSQYDTQVHNPQRWHNSSNTHVQYDQDTGHQITYGQTGDHGTASLPNKRG
ncbi:hypothetical protein BJ170DRAFT_246355 [Xylariales sp. AK1849]|nr:hypothetical protein BJ170DRAFT_246355 [Xylariales sp. AK1849]